MVEVLINVFIVALMLNWFFLEDLRRFFTDKNKKHEKIKIGTLVSLHNAFPPKSKEDIGVIEEIKKDPLGFNYGVRNFHNNKIYFHHSSTIRPFECKEIKITKK